MNEEILYVDETRQDVIVVRVMIQRLLDPEQADKLSSHLCELFDSGALCVLVDLRDVQRLSSVFLRSFIMAGKKAGAKKARLAFCSVSPMIQEGFALTGLNDLFPIYEDENNALLQLAQRGESTTKTRPSWWERLTLLRRSNVPGRQNPPR